MSVHVENQHWSEVEHSLFTFQWASHLVVSDLVSSGLSNEQQKAFSNYLTASADTGVKELVVREADDLPYFRLSFIVEGEDEQQALAITSLAALGGLAHAGIDVESLEFVAAHLAYEEDLKRTALYAHQHNIAAPNVADREYLVDPDIARPIFHDAQAMQVTRAEIAAL